MIHKMILTTYNTITTGISFVNSKTKFRNFAQLKTLIYQNLENTAHILLKTM